MAKLWKLNDDNLIGKGGYGKVFGIDEKSAVKRIEVTGDAALRQETYKEITFMLSLKQDKSPGHENVLCVNGHIEDADFIYVLMDRASCSMTGFVRGKNYTHQYQQMSTPQRSAVASQCFQGLEYLHTKNIVHNDLKPDNLLFFLDEDSIYINVKICDFGLARQKQHLDHSSHGTGNTIGTLPYMAPEVHVQGRKGEWYSDIWSLGAALVMWFSGQPVWSYQAVDYVGIHNELMQKKKLRCMPDSLLLVPDGVRQELQKCLLYDCRQRPTPAQMKEYFEQLAVRGAVGYSPPGSSPAYKKYSRGKPGDGACQQGVVSQQQAELQHDSRDILEILDENKLVLSGPQFPPDLRDSTPATRASMPAKRAPQQVFLEEQSADSAIGKSQKDETSLQRSLSDSFSVVHVSGDSGVSEGVSSRQAVNATLISEFKAPEPVRAMCLTNDSHVAVYTEKNNLYMYTITGTQLSKLSLPRGCDSYGMSRMGNNILVADREKDKVHVFHNKKVIHTLKTGINLRYISATSNVLWMKESVGALIHKVTLENYKIVDTQSITLQKTAEPAGGLAASDDRLAVSWEYKQKVSVYTHTGTLLYHYGTGERGDSDGQLNYPRGVCLDSNNLLYICDCVYNRIVVVDTEGRLVRYMRTDRLPMHIDINNNMLCVGDNHGISIYKPD